MVEFREISRLLSDFPLLFKVDLIFKDFSRKPSKLKYFSSVCEPLSGFPPSPFEQVFGAEQVGLCLI